MSQPLTDREYRWFNEWLLEEFGLAFGPERRDILRSRLEPRRAELGFTTFEQLYFHLKFHPDRAAEIEKLIPHLTNNESYFFREPEQLDAFREELGGPIRERIEARNRQELRILSAGCAAGEEPYTLAILLKEAPLIPGGWGHRITGVDLDPAALGRARRARYTENAFRRLDPRLKDTYFHPRDDGTWELSEGIRKMVEFRRANLADPEWARTLPAQDVIFCRNVLIYFDDEGTRKAIQGLYDALTPGGYLFLGHAETLSRVPSRFEAVRRPGAVFYRRPADA